MEALAQKEAVIELAGREEKRNSIKMGGDGYPRIDDASGDSVVVDLSGSDERKSLGGNNISMGMYMEGLRESEIGASGGEIYIRVLGTREGDTLSTCGFAATDTLNPECDV